MRLLNVFQPKPTLSEKDTALGLRMMTLEGMASNGFTSITTSGLLAAFALVLGANPFQIGILAAIPFIMQPLQIPAILLVEKLRRRKAIAVSAWVVAQLLWFPMALIPFFIRVPSSGAIMALLGLMAVRGIFSAVTNCGWNSWVRDLVPQQLLGRFFSRRLALSAAMAAVFGLGAALFVDYWRGQVPGESTVLGYTYALLFGALFLGLASPVLMSRIPEPLMQKGMGPQLSLPEMISRPLRDKNFRQLMAFLLSWSFALNMAVPFFAVYMLQRLGLPLTAVIGLSVLSQAFNILFLRVWGPLADRFGSKAVLSACASLYLLVVLGWTFTTMPERYFLTVPLLAVLHIFAGIATAGVSLTIATIGMKLAPPVQSAPYLTGASLATNLGAGLGPLFGGFLAHFFSVRELALGFTWADPDRTIRLGVLHLTGFDFLFVLSFVIGLVTLNMLAALREEGEAGREVVLGELRAQTRSALQAMGPVPGPGFVDMLPIGYLRRVPGVDVAIGVTAYQLADIAKTVTLAALSGQRTSVRVARALQSSLERLWKEGMRPPHHDTEVARQAARGAMHAVDESAAEAGPLARSAVLGIVRAMDEAHVSPYDAARGAAYGVVEGASETHADLERAATEAVTGAKDAARALSLNEQEAATQARQGALEAARALGPEAISHVRRVLTDRQTEEPAAPSERGRDRAPDDLA